MMLTLKPTEPIYFLVQRGDYGESVASITFTTNENNDLIMTVHDSKSQMQTAILQSGAIYNAVKVHIHDSDMNHIAYISWFSDTKTIGIDAPKEHVMVLRETPMTKCNFKPHWSPKKWD